MSKKQIQGDGVVGDLVNKVFPTRQNFPPKARKTIKDYQNYVVKSIAVARNPVQSYVTKALNFLSGGTVEEQKKKLNYDELFHLFMVVVLEN